jgi:hypothetical protein
MVILLWNTQEKTRIRKEFANPAAGWYSPLLQPETLETFRPTKPVGSHQLTARKATLRIGGHVTCACSCVTVTRPADLHGLWRLTIFFVSERNNNE